MRIAWARRVPQNDFGASSAKMSNGMANKKGQRKRSPIRRVIDAFALFTVIVTNVVSMLLGKLVIGHVLE